MPSMKTVKRRANAVGAMQQVVKAMDMVATVKLRKVKAQHEALLPFTRAMAQVIRGLQACEGAEDNLFLRARPIHHTAYVVITGDRSLCGTYNSNLSNEALAHMEMGRNEQLITVGAKGYEFFRQRGKNLLHHHTKSSDLATYEDAEAIARLLVDLYSAGEVEEVYLAHTTYQSALSYLPQVTRVLPIGGAQRADAQDECMRYEPGIHEFLTQVVPMYLSAVLYGAMVESETCEQAARMVSMSAAANNAEEILDDLTLAYNRMRQAAITQEITEIISGANTGRSAR
ncbi:MAG: ATP synthase F1 subunit gamma [Clostridiales bacterium]|nr:ATP synthase F1 subunit gamma [Clostridiales bacterium]